MLSALSGSMTSDEQAACSVYVSIQWAHAACLLGVCMQAAAQIQAMEVEQEGLRKELEIAEEDKESLQQRLLGSDIAAPRYACAQVTATLALDRPAWADVAMPRGQARVEGALSASRRTSPAVMQTCCLPGSSVMI